MATSALPAFPTLLIPKEENQLVTTECDHDACADDCSSLRTLREDMARSWEAIGVLRARIRTNQDVLRASCEITRFSAADVERVFAEGGDNNNDATMAVDVGREDEGDGGDGAAAVIQRMAPAMREEMRRRVLAGVPLTAAESSRLATRLQKLDADHARRVGHLIMEETRLLGSSSSSSSYDDDDYYHHHHHDHHRDDEHGGIPPSKRLKSSYNHEGGIGDIQFEVESLPTGLQRRLQRVVNGFWWDKTAASGPKGLKTGDAVWAFVQEEGGEGGVVVAAEWVAGRLLGPAAGKARWSVEVVRSNKNHNISSRSRSSRSKVYAVGEGSLRRDERLEGVRRKIGQIDPSRSKRPATKNTTTTSNNYSGGGDGGRKGIRKGGGCLQRRSRRASGCLPVPSGVRPTVSFADTTTTTTTATVTTAAATVAPFASAGADVDTGAAIADDGASFLANGYGYGHGYEDGDDSGDEDDSEDLEPSLGTLCFNPSPLSGIAAADVLLRVPRKSPTMNS